MLAKIKSFFGLKKSRAGLSMVLLLFAIVWGLYEIFRKGNPVARREVPTPAQVINDITRILSDAGYSQRMISYWIAVSDFETAYWNSALYKNYFNLWGMKQPQTRANTSAGPTPTGFASYNNVPDSVRDLVFYMAAFNYPKDFPSLRAQIEFMKSKGYFEENLEVYFNGVKSRYD